MKYFAALKSVYSNCSTCFKLPVLDAAYSLPAVGLSHAIFSCLGLVAHKCTARSCSLPVMSVTVLLSSILLFSDNFPKKIK
jgi:hypothetical protein